MGGMGVFYSYNALQMWLSVFLALMVHLDVGLLPLLQWMLVLTVWSPLSVCLIQKPLGPEQVKWTCHCMRSWIFLKRACLWESSEAWVGGLAGRCKAILSVRY